MAITKVLKQDLEAAVQTLLGDVDQSKGTKVSLAKRLSDLDDLLKSNGWIKIDFLDTDIKEAIQNLITAKTDTGKDIATRVKAIETSTAAVGDLSNKITMLGEYGNFGEAFTYDTSGNVSKHTVTGDTAFTIDYVYKDPANGTLDYSEKKFKDSANKNVTIKKTYTYDAVSGNITGIVTVTTIV